MHRSYRAQKFIQFEKFCYWRKTVLKIRERILDSLSVAYYPKTIVKFKLPH